MAASHNRRIDGRLSLLFASGTPPPWLPRTRRIRKVHLDALGGIPTIAPDLIAEASPLRGGAENPGGARFVRRLAQSLGPWVIAGPIDRGELAEAGRSNRHRGESGRAGFLVWRPQPRETFNSQPVS